VSIRSLEGPLRLAVDGETLDGSTELLVTKRLRVLQVAVPPYDPDGPVDTSARPTITASTTSTATPAAVNQMPASS
jgi:hypothetical protein